MKPYSIFAEYYDLLTGDVDYPARARYFDEILKRHGCRPEIVLDLACGTGSLTLALARLGYDVIGVDRSPEMLSRAAQKQREGGGALFICQDIRRLDLYGTVDAAVSSLDSVNHLTRPGDLKAMFSRLSLFLNPGGCFVFDLNTPHKMANVLGNNTFVYDYDEIYCVWQNHYNMKTKLCRFDLTFFAHDGHGGYKRYDEHFAEKAYTLRQVEGALEAGGLELLAVYDDMRFETPEEKSERIVIVAKKR